MQPLTRTTAGDLLAEARGQLRRFGVDATDVDGGFRAWREAGLPVERSAE